MSAVELNQQERQQLLDVLRDLDASKSAERRRDKRRDVVVNLVVRKVKSSNVKKSAEPVSIFPGTVVNIATRGVGIKLAQLLEPGDKIVLPLRFREGGGWLVLCQVRSCSKLADGNFRVGAKFVERLEDPEGIAKIPVDWLL